MKCLMCNGVIGATQVCTDCHIKANEPAQLRKRIKELEQGIEDLYVDLDTANARVAELMGERGLSEAYRAVLRQHSISSGRVNDFIDTLKSDLEDANKENAAVEKHLAELAAENAEVKFLHEDSKKNATYAIEHRDQFQECYEKGKQNQRGMQGTIDELRKENARLKEPVAGEWITDDERCDCHVRLANQNTLALAYTPGDATKIVKAHNVAMRAKDASIDSLKTAFNTMDETLTAKSIVMAKMETQSADLERRLAEGDEWEYTYMDAGQSSPRLQNAIDNRWEVAKEGAKELGISPGMVAAHFHTGCCVILRRRKQPVEWEYGAASTLDPIETMLRDGWERDPDKVDVGPRWKVYMRRERKGE